MTLFGAGLWWSQAAPSLADQMPAEHEIIFGTQLGFPSHWPACNQEPLRLYRSRAVSSGEDPG